MCVDFHSSWSPSLAADEKISYTKLPRIKPLISTSGGRFPWATPQLRANRMLVMKALRQDVAVLAFHPYTPLPAGFSAGTGSAITRPIENLLRLLVPPKRLVAFPTGVAALRSNQLDLFITYSNCSYQSISFSSSVCQFSSLITAVCPFRSSEEHTSELQSRGHLVCR